jgi:hypothetical protein
MNSHFGCIFENKKCSKNPLIIKKTKCFFADSSVLEWNHINVYYSDLQSRFLSTRKKKRKNAFIT